MKINLKKLVGISVMSLGASLVFSSEVEVIKDTRLQKSEGIPLSFAQLVEQTNQLSSVKNAELKLDLSNPDHYEFVVNRLAYHGKDIKNSPQLFKGLEKARDLSYSTLSEIAGEEDKHLHQWLEAKEAISVENNDELSIHRIQSAVPDEKSVDAETGDLFVTNDVIYSLTDIIVFDQNGNQVGIPGFVEGYVDDANALIAAAPIYPDRVAANYFPYDEFTIESYSYYEKAEGSPVAKMKVTPVSAYEFMGKGAANTPGGMVVYKPADTVPADNPDGSIRVCLNRDQNDCDIPMMYPQQTDPSKNKYLDVKLDFAGRAELLVSDVEVLPFYENTGTKEYTDIFIATNTGEYSHLNYSDEDAEAFIKHFNVIYDPDQKGTIEGVTKGKNVTIVEWNIPKDSAVFGKAPLFDRFKNVTWHMKIAIKYKIGQRVLKTILYADNQQGVVAAWKLKDDLPWMYFEYSCIAKGTLVTMADGSSKAIEEVFVGETVMSGEGPMKVVDTSIGYEAIPMYEISDSLGQSVLLTETHPVITENRGVVWAKEITVGDELMTRKGESKVLTVEKVIFNETVHNLDLEPANSKSVADTSAVMYAGGIPVGDLDYQSELSFKDQAPSSKEVMLQKLPEAWHQDYLNSLAK